MFASLVHRLVLIMVLAPMVACSTVSERLPAVPADRALSVAFLGIPNARFHLTDKPEELASHWLHVQRRLHGPEGARPAVEHALALSGGGDNGAFGAGILYGWTRRGDRPEFSLVTGVSTGALIAPFAFLGPTHDESLKTVYTTIHQSDIAIQRPLLAALSGDSLADTTPLTQLIERYVSADMIAGIAREYRRGRLLLIGTTDLDLGQPVIWNIGAIAASGHPQSVSAIRRILLASASIPGAFPPVAFDIDIDGSRRQELHADGGTTSQVFLYPGNVPLRSLPAEVRNRRRVAWIIRNGRTMERPTQVARGLLPVAQRSIGTLITANGVGDIYRLYLVTRRDGVDFNLAYITRRFNLTSDTPFDTNYMRALFAHGEGEIARNAAWTKQPPGFAP